MRRKGMLVGATVVIALLSAVLAGQHTGGGFCWWGNREPIYIYGNDAFTCENGVIAGSGTSEDPFVIEGWYIDNPPTDYGIYLDHTTACVVIRDCVVECAQAAGIYFNSVANVRVEGCQLSLNRTGIYFLNSRHNIVEATVIAHNHYGVVMAASSRDNCITGNSFIENGVSGLDPERRSQWYCYGIGNYWSDYDGADFNGDGVGDRPYFRLADCYPLVCPPSATAVLETPISPVKIPSAVIAPEPVPVLEPPAPEPTPPAPEPAPQPEAELEPAVAPPALEPEPEAAPEPVPEPELESEQPLEPAAAPEPEPVAEPVPELPIESVPPPEAPQTAPTSINE